MKKILLVTRVSGFVPQFEKNDVAILQEMGYEVHYAANFNVVVYGKDNSRLQGTGIICHQIDFTRSPFSKDVKKAYNQLEQLLLEESFDAIHCHMPMSGVIARKAAQAVRKKTGRQIPVLYTAHGFHFYSGAPLQNWCYYFAERHYARYTDRLILINEEDYQRGQKFPIRGKVERINGIGIDLTQYQGIHKIPMTQENREKYGIPLDHYVLISVGELTKRKNHSVMIQAMAELKDLKLTYLICGSGPMEEELKALVQELGLEKRVRFAGYVEDVIHLVAQADCFVFPSLQEGLPVAVMEAMAAGLPVIASRIRGITDLIEHTKGGYLVRGFDPVDYAVKVRRLFTEKEGKEAVPRPLRRKQMGEWNQKQVEKFSLAVVDSQMRKIYKDVLES